MFAKTTAMAAREFLSKLPEEVVMLALEAVELQERLDGMTDKQPPLRGCFCYSMIGSYALPGEVFVSFLPPMRSHLRGLSGFPSDPWKSSRCGSHSLPVRSSTSYSGSRKANCEG